MLVFGPPTNEEKESNTGNKLDPMNTVPPRTTTRLHSPVLGRIMLTKRASELAPFSSRCFRAMVFCPLGGRRLLDLPRHRAMMLMLILRLVLTGRVLVLVVVTIAFNGPSGPLLGGLVRDFFKPFLKVVDKPRHR